jgi:hypothetical protein
MGRVAHRPLTMMRRLRFLILILALSVTLAGTALLAQSGGQLWVRLYQDLNANGQRDTGEPLLTRGAAVSLQDATGAVIATGLLDDSPNGAQGLIGFQGLQPGAYTAAITSADVAPTGDSSFTRDVTGDGVPIVIEFGAQPILDPVPETSPVRGLFGLPIYLGERTQVARVALGLLGACIVAAFMTVLGTITYWVVSRRARRDLASGSPATSVGIPAVPS